MSLPPTRRRGFGWTLGYSLWMGWGLLSFGFLWWVGFWGRAARTRQVAWVVAASAFTVLAVLTVILFVVADQHEAATGDTNLFGFAGLAWVAMAVGGLAAALSMNPSWLRFLREEEDFNARPSYVLGDGRRVMLRDSGRVALPPQERAWGSYPQAGQAGQAGQPGQLGQDAWAAQFGGQRAGEQAYGQPYPDAYQQSYPGAYPLPYPPGAQQGQGPGSVPEYGVGSWPPAPARGRRRAQEAPGKGGQPPVPARVFGGSVNGSLGAPMLDLNVASLDQLAAVPGLGEAYARAIVAEREHGGPYGRATDVVVRAEVPPHVFMAFSASVTVRGGGPRAVPQPGTRPQNGQPGAQQRPWPEDEHPGRRLEF